MLLLLEATIVSFRYLVCISEMSDLLSAVLSLHEPYGR